MNLIENPSYKLTFDLLFFIVHREYCYANRWLGVNSLEMPEGYSKTLRK